MFTLRHQIHIAIRIVGLDKMNWKIKFQFCLHQATSSEKQKKVYWPRFISNKFNPFVIIIDRTQAVKRISRRKIYIITLRTWRETLFTELILAGKVFVLIYYGLIEFKILLYLFFVKFKIQFACQKPSSKYAGQPKKTREAVPFSLYVKRTEETWKLRCKPRMKLIIEFI